MDFIHSFWGSKPAGTIFEGDTVYSSHLLDNLNLFDSFLMTTTWFYKDVLDADKLHHSLTRLLETGDWKKLGGRYRRPDRRTLKLYVPEKFTPERPAVAYSKETFSMKLRAHPACGTIPKTTERVLFRPQMELKTLAHEPRHPTTLLDLLESDRPALSLRIITFEDATLMTLIWPHAMMDAQGLGALVKAWSMMLADTCVRVPPLAGAQHDVLRELAGSKGAFEEESAVSQKRLYGFGLFVFFLRLLWDMFWDPKEAGVIHISKETAQGLRRKALGEALDKSDSEGERPWISEQDALTSVWIKSLALSGSRPRPVTVLVPFDLRRRLPGSLDPQASYVQNMVLPACCNVAEAVAAGPLGTIAVAIRQTLQRQTARPQILSSLRSKREARDANNDSMEFPGPSNSMLLSTTDWSKARFLQTGDFGPAVIKQGEADGERDNPVGLPFYFHADALRSSHSMTNAMNMVVHLGENHQGGHWFMAILPPGAWKRIRENLEEFSR